MRGLSERTTPPNSTAMLLAPGASSAYILAMAATLKTIQASVSADGILTLAEPVTGPALAVVTLLVEEPEPNETTLEALDEPLAGLPRFATIAALKADLES